ncbi:MAG TPA: DUF4870 domain-containing protein [Candidatus Omnitrophota bacterium]|nr:DUF4870 domain-containing protein [Candidatus Omnitrophota bacterium]
MAKDLGKSSTGIQPNVAGLLCYLAGFITGIIFLVLEKENKFIRFHAMQSIIAFGGIFVLQIAFVTLVFTIFLVPILNIVGLILWVILMIKAYQGEMFKLPVVGELAEKKI